MGTFVSNIYLLALFTGNNAKSLLALPKNKRTGNNFIKNWNTQQTNIDI